MTREFVDKLRKRYKIPKGLSRNELIAFLVALMHKAKRRKRPAAAKSKPQTGNVEPPTIRGSVTPGTNAVNMARSTEPIASMIPRILPRTDAPQVPTVSITNVAPEVKRPRDHAVVITRDGRELPIGEFPAGNGKVAFATDEFKDFGKSIVDHAHRLVESAESKAARTEHKRAEEEAQRKRAEKRVKLSLKQQLEAWNNKMSARIKDQPTETAKLLIASEKKLGNNFTRDKEGKILPMVQEYIEDIMPRSSDEAKSAAIKSLYNNNDAKTIVGIIGHDGYLPDHLQAEFSKYWEAESKRNMDELTKDYPEAGAYVRKLQGDASPPLPETSSKPPTPTAAAGTRSRSSSTIEPEGPIFHDDSATSIKQTGRGHKLPRMLDNFEIDRVMKKYPGFLGAIAHNQIPSLLPFVHRGMGDIGLIINTDPTGKPGQHWQALFVSPTRDKTVEWYDSFGDPMDPKLMPAVKQLVKKLDAPHHLKFKENRIDEQNANTDSCGYYCVKFLADRFRGVSFKDATGFPHDEKELARWKTKFSGFKYLDV